MTVTNYTKDISSISKANPCVVTTSEEHGYSTNDFVRITNCGNAGNSNFGMSLLTRNKYKIKVIDTTSFSLHNPVTGNNIDSTTYETYVSDGKVNLIRTLYQYT